jgi:glucose 1-dehydrogenase
MSRVAGSVAAVTGAESGIGAACAKALAEAGANVAVLYFEDAHTAQTTLGAVEAHGRRGVAAQLDVRDERSVEAAFDDLQGGLGIPDILVNSAGLNQSGVPVADMQLAQWQNLIATDLTGPFLTCRRFIRDLRTAKRPGRIINISSIHARVMRAGAADYDAAKGGLQNLTATMALEVAPLRINVNAIAPGMILTPMNARALEDADYRRRLEESIPWGRAGTAEEIARIAVFLASSDADYITGATITVDGGLSLVLGQKA